jgi:hypothetical protein
MRKLAIVLAVSALVATFGLSAALAASPSQTQCESAGGTFSRDGGQVSCTFTTSDPVGNSESSGGHSQTVDTTDQTTSNGTLNNRPQREHTSDCQGPGNSTAQC